MQPLSAFNQVSVISLHLIKSHSIVTVTYYITKLFYQHLPIIIHLPTYAHVARIICIPIKGFATYTWEHDAHWTGH